MPQPKTIEGEVAIARKLTQSALGVIGDVAPSVPVTAPLYREHLAKARHHLDVAAQQLANAQVIGLPRPRVLSPVLQSPRQGSDA